MMAGSFERAAALKRMAFRNLARHKVKSALTITAVAVSVCVYIFVDGWLVGMNIDSRRNIVSYETGAAKVQTKLYFEKLEDLPMYESFPDWRIYAEALSRAGYDSAPRFVFTGTIDSETGSAPIEFTAVDPALDGRLFRYGSGLESGRNIRAGAFEVILGSMAADKLKVGLPQRPTKNDLEDDIIPSVPAAEQDFVRGLYEPAVIRGGGMFAPKTEPPAPGNERYVLKKDASPEDLERYWALLADTGRMDVSISTVIDMKAAPDTVSALRWDTDISPLLTPQERDAFLRAYEWDELLSAYYLASDDGDLLAEVLNSLVRIDYAGAVRHVYQLITAEVVGVLNTPDPKLNGNFALIPLDALQDERGLMLEGRVTELAVRIKGAKDTVMPGAAESPGAIESALKGELAKAGKTLPEDLGVFGWEGYVKDYLAASAGDNWSTRILVIILFILSFLGIANTMLLAILERTKETGMMRAQGMTDGELLFTYMIEAGMVGLFGAAIGVVLGCLINIPMVNTGIDLSAMTEAMGGDIGYRVNGFFRSAWNIPVIAGSGVLATVISAVMAFFPTRKALSMAITDSMRFE
ncbi:MAG: FtsX-like permease family protein [Spirochaetaceae bacterium]|jgi:ABC-type lipoprotein release transport system permease subunit|nr:FtsX-like permease family protein [Spirochaetaceae bacterium]